MKFLTLLLLCIAVQDISSAPGSITLIKYLAQTKLQIDTLLANKQKQVNALPGGANIKVPTAPTLPAVSVPVGQIVLVKPPIVPLPYPQCDLKALIELLKSIFGRVKGSCGYASKIKGKPTKAQLDDLKKNVTVEISGTLNVNVQVSYKFPTFSEAVDPKIKDFQSGAGKVIDSLSAASNATDPKAAGKSVDVAVKNLAICLKGLFSAVNGVTGSAKPAAGTNEADAKEASEQLLSSFLPIMKAILDMLTSLSGQCSLQIGDITKSLGTAVDTLSSKVSGGSVKILGNVCVEFTDSLTPIIGSVSSVDVDATTKDFEKIESDVGALTDSVSKCASKEEEEEKATEEKPTEEKPTEPPADKPTEPPADKPTEPTADKPAGVSETLLSIIVKIQESFESMSKACAPLKTDVPSIGDSVDGPLKEVSAALTAVLSVVQKSEGTSVTDLSAQIDSSLTALLKALAGFLTKITALQDSLAKDTSVAATTACSVLKLLISTTLSITFKSTSAISVSCEKLSLFSTVTLSAVVELVGKIDVKGGDFKKIATDLTAATAPTEVNEDACTKVVDGLGKKATEAVGKIKPGDDGKKFDLQLSFILKALSYTLKKFKAPTVVTGISSLQTNFSVLIKQLFEALSCAEDSKANSTPAADAANTTPAADAANTTPTADAANTTPAPDATKETPECKCKPVEPDSFKLFFTTLISILDASKAITSDTSLDPKILKMYNLILKTLLTIVKEVLTGLSTKVTEQKVDVSILLTLGVKALTAGVGGAEINFETLSSSIDGILSYGNVVDAAKPALGEVTECETTISKTEPAKAGPLLSELSTSCSDALTILSETTATLKKYFTKPVGPAGAAVTKISLILTEFVKSVTKASGDETKISAALNDFLLQISLALQELLTSYSDIISDTKLDPKGDNAISGLKYAIKATVSVINSIIVSIKVFVVKIPTDVSECFTAVSDAVGADVKSPDSDPSELAGKIKGICEKYNTKEPKADGDAAPVEASTPPAP